MSFFIRGKGATLPDSSKNKRLKKKIKKKPGKTTQSTKRKKLEDEEISSESDIENQQENKKVDYDSEEEHETAQEKRIRLTKKYLEEIEREEKERQENDLEQTDAIAHRLQQEVLEKAGKLRKPVAHRIRGADVEQTCCLKCKEQSRPPVCLVVHPNGAYIYSASKDSVIVKWSIEKKCKVGIIPRQKTKGPPDTGHSAIIMALAVSSDGKYLASGCMQNKLIIWDADSLSLLHVFSGHRGPVTGLAFRRNDHSLYSCSQDKTVKIWSIDDMAYVETLFGHQDSITSIDAGVKERCITSGGMDSSLRMWKIVEESQLVFTQQNVGFIEQVALLNDEYFLSCTNQGCLALWIVSKKKPIHAVRQAHGQDTTNSTPHWISCIAALYNSDLAASGSADGNIKLWKCENFQRLVHLTDIAVTGFVNSLAFLPSGDRLVAAVGKEHRLGRWWSIKEAKNCVLIFPLLQD